MADTTTRVFRIKHPVIPLTGLIVLSLAGPLFLVGGIAQGFVATTVTGVVCTMMDVGWFTVLERRYRWTARADDNFLYLIVGFRGRIADTVAIMDVAWIGCVRVTGSKPGWLTGLQTTAGTTYDVATNRYREPRLQRGWRDDLDSLADAIRTSPQGQFASEIWTYVAARQGPHGALASRDDKPPTGMPPLVHLAWSAAPGSAVSLIRRSR